MMSEHLVTIKTGLISLGWTELVIALEELVDQIPADDIRTTHVKRLEAITEVMETKLMERLEHKRQAKISATA